MPSFALVIFLVVLSAVVLADFFSCSIRDHVTTNRIYRNFTTEGSITCISECQNDENCASYNYEYEPNHASGHVCQLSRCGENGTLIKKWRFWFHQMRIPENEVLCNTPEEKTGAVSFGGLETSVILQSSRNPSMYFKHLLDFLGAVNRTWKACYRSGGSSFAASVFHTQCDSKGPTITIVRAGRNIFGGYIDKSWKTGMSCLHDWVKSDQAFLFSLYSHHDDGFKPRKFAVKKYGYAALHCANMGPTLGRDLVIRPGQSTSYSEPDSYEIPPSCKALSPCAFYTGQTKFTPSDVEVFYEVK